MRVPIGGDLSLEDGSTDIAICVNDGVADMIAPLSNNDQNAGYAFIITNEDNIILSTFSEPSIDFENFEEGYYRIWGVAFLEELTAAMGDNVLECNLGIGLL
ncbi:MAG: hypothetical protein R2795_25305 [Saprospiraceae bacterium]